MRALLIAMALAGATACAAKHSAKPTPAPTSNCAKWTCDGGDCWCEKPAPHRK